MKYFKGLFFAGLFAATSVFAQGGAHFGVHVGLGMAALAFSTSEEDLINGESSRLVFAVGGIYSMPLSESVTLAPEALLNYAALPGQKSSDIGLNFPIMFKFYTLDFLYVQAGPQLGFSFYYANDEGKKSKDRNVFEAGPAVGLGYQIDASSLIDVRFFYGMTKYFDVIDPGAQSIQILLGYSYLF